MAMHVGGRLLASAAPFVYSFDPSKMPKIRAALGRVRANQGNATILCIGDSTVLGFGSTTSGTGNQKTFSWPSQLAAALNAAGINAHANSYMGFGANSPSGAQTSQYDPRIAVGSSWSYNVPSLGGAALFATTATNSITFTSGTAFDSYKVWYIKGGGLGSFTVADGVNTNAVSEAGGSLALTSSTFTVNPGSPATHTLTVTWASGAAGVFFNGFEVWDSTKKWVDVVNAGWVGSKTGDWNPAANGYDPTSAIASFAPDLTIVSLGPNDWNTGTTVAAFQTSLQAIVTKAKTVGDVIVLSCPPSSPATKASIATQAPYIAAMRAVALAVGVPFVDGWSRAGGDYVTANAAGLMFDDVHPSGAGYVDLAQPLATLLDSF